MIALLALLTTAQAQDPALPDIDAQTYRIPVDARHTLWTDEAWIGPMGYYDARVLTHYSRGALGAYNEADGLTHFGLKDALSLNLVGAMHFKYARIGVDLPVYAMTTSDVVSGGAGLGDAAVDLKVSPVEGFALVGRFTVPTSSVATPLGSPGLTYETTVVASKEFNNDNTTLAGNLGFRGLPDGALDNQIVMRAGLGQMVEPNAGISFDVAMRMDTATGFAGTSSPVEALVGGWGRMDNGIVLRGGVGTGLSNGAGSALFRGLFVVSYEPPIARDRDEDGFADKDDPCPDEAEDKDGFEPDGCPDPDNDQDGILDVDDRCPDEAEDVDGYMDDDGCVDAKTEVRFQVFNSNGLAVGGASSVIVGGDQPIKGHGDFRRELMPGTYTFKATAEGYEDGEAEIVVEEGAPQAASVFIKAEVKMSTVSIDVVDINGTKLDAHWAWNGEAELPIDGGEAAIAMIPGKYLVIVGAEDHDSEKLDVTLAKGKAKSLKVELVPHLGTLKVIAVDKDGNPIPNATWQYGDQAEQPMGDGGIAEAELKVGGYPMIVQAPGFKPHTAMGKIQGGKTTEVRVVMKRIKVQITAEKIDIADKVYFASGKADIKPESFELLDDVAKIILDHPKVAKVRIEGHTDVQGGEASNLKLSEDRAAAVLEYMVAAGVERERLVSQGFGETKPIAPGDSAEANEKNRRVEFYIVNDAE